MPLHTTQVPEEQVWHIVQREAKKAWRETHNDNWHKTRVYYEKVLFLFQYRSVLP